MGSKGWPVKFGPVTYYRPVLEACTFHGPNVAFEGVQLNLLKRGSVVCDDCWMGQLKRDRLERDWV